MVPYRILKIPLRVYIAQTTRFLMYFDQAVVQIDLDASYLRSPVLITSPAFKPWQSLAVLCSGDAQQDRALDAALFLKARSGLPLDCYRLVNGDGWEAPAASVTAAFRHNHELETKSLAEGLYEIPHDALVIISTGNQVLVKSLLFGSLLEKVQATLANNLLVVGPNVAAASVWPVSVHPAYASVDEAPERAAAWR
ncbi:MAG: hypothetical protein ABIL58_18875 [Pseudomonadota bacterium]